MRFTNFSSRAVLSFFCALALLVSGCLSSGNSTPALAKCSTESVKGTYVYFGQGSRQGQHGFEDGHPYFETGIEIYDGKGHVENIYSSSETQGTVHDSATYQVDANCAGTVNYASGGSYTIYAHPSGKDFTFMQVAGGDGQAFSGENTRVSESTTPQCSAETLKGSYMYFGQGFVGNLEMVELYLETGFETFDGAGALTNTYADSASRRTHQDSATFKLNPNCVGTVTYASGNVFNIFASPAGDYFTYIQEYDGKQILSGTEKRVSLVPIPRS